MKPTQKAKLNRHLTNAVAAQIVYCAACDNTEGVRAEFAKIFARRGLNLMGWNDAALIAHSTRAVMAAPHTGTRHAIYWIIAAIEYC